MSTTNLFVELLVIGVGVVIWVSLLILTVFGVPAFNLEQEIWLALTIPLIATTYVAGIIWDRLVDRFFERVWVDRWRGVYFPQKIDYYNARRIILMKSERLSELLEYGRSRMRICRAWALNVLLIGVFFAAMLKVHYPAYTTFTPKTLFAMSIFLLFSIGAWSAWASMTKTEFRKIKEQAEFLNNATPDQS